MFEHDSLRNSCAVRIIFKAFNVLGEIEKGEVQKANGYPRSLRSLRGRDTNDRAYYG